MGKGETAEKMNVEEGRGGPGTKSCGRDGQGTVSGGVACCLICGACGGCCIIVLLLIAMACLGIAKIVIGAVYLHDCDYQENIPIWLIVSGCASMLFGGFGRRQSTGNEEEDQSSKAVAANICGAIGFFFNLAWIICGCVWIYPTWGKMRDDDYVKCTDTITTDCTEGSCDNTVLTFAYAMLTIDWIFFSWWCILIAITLRKRCQKDQCN